MNYNISSGLYWKEKSICLEYPQRPLGEMTNLLKDFNGSISKIDTKMNKLKAKGDQRER
jgi:hypothetical protein